jgi:hypothetical protein
MNEVFCQKQNFITQEWISAALKISQQEGIRYEEKKNAWSRFV